MRYLQYKTSHFNIYTIKDMYIIGQDLKFKINIENKDNTIVS